MNKDGDKLSQYTLHRHFNCRNCVFINIDRDF